MIGQNIRCTTTCPSALPYLNITISTDNTYRYVTTFQCPPYSNPGWTNPNSACAVQVTYKLPLNPKFAKIPIPVAQTAGMYNSIRYLSNNPTPILGALGVMVNGVNLFGVGSPCGFRAPCPPTGLSNYVDAVISEGHTLDTCGGHPSPTGEYHIHSAETLHTANGRLACSLPADVEGEHSKLLGWAFDGFGIYGEYSENGKVPAQLDACGGHTHEINGENVYHYHLPHEDQYPWTIGCFKGCPQVSNNQRQLIYAETDTQYGCPQGLENDPDPLGGTGGALIEQLAHITITLSITFALLITSMY